MVEAPLVSVIVAVFNAEKYIAQTIESVRAQTYTSWEMILVDDCSTDTSCDVIERYLNDVNIKLIRLPGNSGGPATPRNVAMEAANGKYLAFLDADDVWEPEKLQQQIEFMQTNGLSFSSTGIVNIDEKGSVIPAWPLYGLWSKLKPKTLEGLVISNFIVLSSVIIETAKMTPFNTDKEYIAVEDYCKWLELFESGTAAYGYLEQPLLRYRVVEGSISERHIARKQEARFFKCAVDFICAKNRYDLLPFVYKSAALRYLRYLMRR